VPLENATLNLGGAGFQPVSWLRQAGCLPHPNAQAFLRRYTLRLGPRAKARPAAQPQGSSAVNETLNVLAGVLVTILLIVAAARWTSAEWRRIRAARHAPDSASDDQPRGGGPDGAGRDV